ncbi:tetratricopeptide repeat protein [Paenibacillus sp. GYB003]|uniref:tetratricopeptide repeat protein n=1 Tax=Paenibacillus sp. GYB003 TaxID=2994392 RepID=UPI002F965BE4
MERERFAQAIFWYSLAADYKPNGEESVQYSWLPHMQLGLCFFRIGDYERSYRHNRIAHRYIPDDEGIVQNLKLLESILGASNTRNQLS